MSGENLNDFNFSILIINIVLLIYLAIINFKKRDRFIANKLLVFGFLFQVVLYGIYIFQILYQEAFDLTILSRYFFSILMFLALIALIITQVFPRWEKRSSVLMIFVLLIPGLFLIGFTSLTDLIIFKSIFDLNISNVYGPFMPLYIIIFSLYIIWIYLSFLNKIKKYENEAFKPQALAFQAGLVVEFLLYLVFFIILPFAFDIHEYLSIGLFGGLLVNFTANYALSDEKHFNFIKFYKKLALWSVYIIILFLLSWSFIELTGIFNLINNNTLLFAGTVIMIMFFLFLYYLFIMIKNIILNKKNKNLEKIFNKISSNISRLSEIRKYKINWDLFFHKGIDLSCEMLNIEGAVFFLFNEETSAYEAVHNYNGKIQIDEIGINNEIILSLKKTRGVIEKSLIYTDDRLNMHRAALILFLRNHNIEYIFPVFSYKRELIALLLLGKSINNETYSSDFYYFLENLRNQLTGFLENFIFFEEIRKTQIKKRDMIVVRNVKKRIIPFNNNDIEGFRISTFYINNSEFGGDYFNTSGVFSDKAGIYIANTSDYGLESALLALQMNSVFHTQANMYESPEHFINIINKVLCSSRFTDKYATALFIIYNSSTREISFSNAAFNPVIIFDPKKDGFIEFDIEGIPVGIDIGFHYKNTILFAPSGGIGLCYSNGLSSAFDKSGNNYSVARIKEIIRLNKNDSPKVLIRKIYKDFKNFVLDSRLLNDVTVVVFKTA